MVTRPVKTQPSLESVEIFRTWASQEPSPAHKRVLIGWSPVRQMIQVAEAEAQKLESKLAALLKASDARLRDYSLCEPLLVDAGRNRWLQKEREESYSDWLAWIFEQLQRPPGSAADVIGVLGLEEPELITNCHSLGFTIEREHYTRYGRFDLLLTLGKSVTIIVEVKRYSAEASDTAKQAGYSEWLKSKNVQHPKALLLTTDADREEYDGFKTLRWDDVCIRLRHLLPALSTRIGLVKAAMFVAFVTAVETNLLNLVAPSQETDAVERLSYAKTVEHLKRYLGGVAL